MTRLSVADITFPLLELDDFARLARLLGFDAVDVFAIPEQSQLKPADVVADMAGAARRVREAVDGLTVSDFFVHPGGGFHAELSLNTPDAARRAEARDWFLRMLAFANAIGARGVTVMPGPHWPTETRQSSLSRAADELAWRVEQAHAAGLELSTEPHTQSVIDAPELALELVERAPGLALTVDYSHFVHDGYDDDAIEPLLAHARHLHARPARRGRLQESLKHNTIDFARIVERLLELGFSGYVCCENIWFAPLGCDDVDNLSETILLRDRLVAAGATARREGVMHS
jgi:sugar phosphate isomerase/epimerase